MRTAQWAVRHVKALMLRTRIVVHERHEKHKKFQEFQTRFGSCVVQALNKCRQNISKTQS